MPKGFARVAAVSLPVHLGDVSANEQEIRSAMESLRRQGVQLAVFPELCLTGYTLGDLLLQPLVQAASWESSRRHSSAKRAGRPNSVSSIVPSAKRRMWQKSLR